MFRTKCIIILLSVFFYCTTSVQKMETVYFQKADLVLNHGRIITVDDENPEVEAVAVFREKIIGLGSDEKIANYIGSDTKIIDLKGKFAMPGFIDAHAHFASGGNSLRTLNFRGVRSVKKIREMIAERIKQLPEGAVVQGGKYDHTLFHGQKWPAKEDLDTVSPNNPVVIRRVDGHSCWVNSLALKQSGITKDTPDPFGGEILRDSNGEPTGILKETASRLLNLTGPEINEETGPSNLELAIEHAVKLGLTSIHTSTSLQELDEIRELNKKGLLKVRIYGWLPVSGLDTYIEKGIKQGQGDNMIKIGFQKMFIDGTLGSGTALLFESFEDEPSKSGLAMYEKDEFYALVEKAHKNGYQIGVHAIGDKGVNWVLNAVEEAQKKHGKKGLRHRIEHAQIIIPEDVPRFEELGVIASMQPTHCTTDMRFCERRVGLQRSKNAYIWRTLLNNGAHLAFGTDWSVEPLDPMRGVYSCVARKNIEDDYPDGGWFPEQKLSVYEAIKYYTLGSAYASFEENIKGSLEIGKLADIIVLSEDITKIPPKEILDTKVLYTILGGKVVYEKKN